MSTLTLSNQFFTSTLMDRSISINGKCISYTATNQNVHIDPNTWQEKKVTELFTLRKVARSPSDEIALTELFFDSKDMTCYEITSTILHGEEEVTIPRANFACFINNSTKEFFIEISTPDAIEMFTSSSLIKVMELAEQTGAPVVYICLRNSIEDKSHYLKTFRFLGFEELSQEEQQKISATKTYGILKCPIAEEGEL